MPDLFGQKMVAAMVAATVGEISNLAPSDDPSELRDAEPLSDEVARESDVADSQPSTLNSEQIPARMLNEFVYCPRLYFYEHVEGIFVESVDTLRGAAIHARVDGGKGSMPQSRGAVSAPANANGDGDVASPERPVNGAGTALYLRTPFTRGL